MIGKLLGHTKVGITAGYTHLAHDAEKAAAARTGDRNRRPSRAAIRRSGIGEDGRWRSCNTGRSPTSRWYRSRSSATWCSGPASSPLSVRVYTQQHRQDRLRAVERLNLVLFIHTKHQRAVRRREKEPNDVSDLV